MVDPTEPLFQKIGEAYNAEVKIKKKSPTLIEIFSSCSECSI